MTTQSELNLKENEDGLQTEDETQAQAQEVDQYDPEEERRQAEEYFKEFTSQGKSTEEEPEDSEEDSQEDEAVPAEGGEDEESDEPDAVSSVTKEDEKKAAKAFAQVEETKGGKANYIDHDLINSIEDKELRQRVWALANTAQSHYGRVVSKEQEVNKLRNQIAQLEAEREVAKQSATSKSQEKRIDSQAQDKIARLKRDYPDLADSIEAMFSDQLESKTKELRELIDNSVVPIKQRYEEDSRQEEIQRLQEAANDIFHTSTTGITFREVVASPDFKTWLDNQDESIKRLANSDRAAEVISVLKNFEYDYSREYQKAYGKSWVEAVTGEGQAKKPNSTNPSTNPELAKRADEIKQKRESKKKAAITGITPGRQSTSNDASADADAYFNHFAKQSRYAK